MKTISFVKKYNYMSLSLFGKSVLSISEFSGKEIRYLLDLAKELKNAGEKEIKSQSLKGKHLVLLGEEPAIHVRCSLEIAAKDLGLHFTSLSKQQWNVNSHERETFHLLGKLYSIGIWLGKDSSYAERLHKGSRLPVINAFNKAQYPLQALSDLLTMQEHCDKPLRKISFCYIGNSTGSMANSLREAATRIGMDMRIVESRGVKLSNNQTEVIDNKRIFYADSISEAVRGVDFICTDSDSDGLMKIDGIEQSGGYIVTMDTLNLAKNPKVRFMHSLPALEVNQMNSEISEKIEFKGADKEVYFSLASVVSDQTENLLFITKALLIAIGIG